MVQQQVVASLPTEFGKFKILAHAADSDSLIPHIVLLSSEFDPSQVAYVRIHSECMTGDIFGSYRCDCGAQLQMAMEMAYENKGMLIYLRQEGRGIGIINKLKAYNLQEDGLDTVEANTHLGFEADERIYQDALDILSDLGVSKIHLITNNPSKVKAFENSDIEVVSRVPLMIPPRAENLKYYQTKKDVMGHSLDW